ncbi:MAG: viperin family antiviral radical SAM protein [Bacteroidales bacterium]|nr:viperin family antiviral radical SAM protein [Bacteroidales bacterium]
MISTVNFHLTSKCNYQCKYCFAHFCEVESQLNVDDRKKLVKALCAPKWVDKINFVGGEPTLIGDQLIDLMMVAKGEKSHPVRTSVTTNSSLISPDWIEKAAPFLDILTISIDSQFEDTNRKCGRCCKANGKVLSKEHYIALAAACHKNGIQLKINTVVSSINVNEDMADFINVIRPFHWKIFQVLKVDGENDVDFSKYAITGEEFDEYIENQRNILNDKKVLVKESNDLMRGSYLMVNP